MKTLIQKLRVHSYAIALTAIFFVGFALLNSNPQRGQREGLIKSFYASEAVMTLGENAANWANANGSLPDRVSKTKPSMTTVGAFYLVSNLSSVDEPVEELAYSCFMIQSPDTTTNELFVTFAEIRRNRKPASSEIFSLHGAVTSIPWGRFSEKLAGRKWSFDMVPAIVGPNKSVKEQP